MITEKSVLERFHEKYEIDPVTGCWVWVACSNENGYGLIRYNRKLYKAHRLSYELFVDEIPDGLFVCHRCDNPICVNPDHLFLGSHADNMRDMQQKGRMGDRSGENAPPAKISQEDSIWIRELYATGNYTQKQLGEMFGVSQSNISCIVIEKTWSK